MYEVSILNKNEALSFKHNFESKDDVDQFVFNVQNGKDVLFDNGNDIILIPCKFLKESIVKINRADDLANKDIRKLDLGTRITNALYANDIRYIKDLFTYTKKHLKKLCRLGAVSIDIVDDKLKEIGLHLA